MPHLPPEQLDIQPLVTIEGPVERIVYENQDSGFLVARMQAEGLPGLTTFVGNLLTVSPGETVRLSGRWVMDRQFGRQLRVESFETILPAHIEGIEKYLGSGLIEGIGPVYAKRLVEAFGVETLRVIDEQPNRLQAVPGIGKKRAQQIRDGWASQKSIQSIMVFLQGHGITTAQAVKIYKKYGERAMAVLRQDPYRLAEDIAGISFLGADKIAGKLGIAKDAPARLQAGLLHIMEQASRQGHVYLPEADLLLQAIEILNAPPESLPPALAEMTAQGKLTREQDELYLPRLYKAERDTAHLLQRLLATPLEPLTVHLENALKWVEKTHNLTLSTEQRQAIASGIERKVLIVTGGPGTGKTTVLNSLLAILERKGLSFVLAAPTGRAAKRMEAATNREARTVHRLLEFSPISSNFSRDEFNPLITDLLVLDEASMIDVQLMHSILRALPPFARLLLVGDVDQLPSVGPGNVLLDIIASQTVPVVRLETVFRQAAESGIISGAHAINTGRIPVFNEKDFFLIERQDPDKALQTIVELVTHRIPAKFGLDPVRDVQVLAPMRRGQTGVIQLNEALQEALNPNGEPVPRRALRLGDKVMQLRNNYELDVYNGDTGILTMCSEGAKEVEVTFDDGRAVIYTFDDLDNLTLAYAATIHKSQGSEYPAVIIPFMPQHFMMLQRNVLYTGITRGKQLVIIVGDKKAIGIAVRNSRNVQRNTRLTGRLRNERK